MPALAKIVENHDWQLAGHPDRTYAGLRIRVDQFLEKIRVDAVRAGEIATAKTAVHATPAATASTAVAKADKVGKMTESQLAAHQEANRQWQIARTAAQRLLATPAGMKGDAK